MFHFIVILGVFVSILFIPLAWKLEDIDIPFYEKQEVANQFLAFHAKLWPALLVIFVLLLIHSIVVSHRIAGPIYRIRKVLKSVGDGDFSIWVNLRMGDYMTKEANVINAMNEALSEKIRYLQRECQAVAMVATELGQSVDRFFPDEVKQKMDELDARLSELESGLGRFKLAPAAVDEEEEVHHLDEVSPILK